MDTMKLNNGVEMPQLGYGVYQVSPAEAERCVSDALGVGYRMVDTAQAYHNEEGVGAGLVTNVVSVAFFKQPFDWAADLVITLIITGVVVLNIFSNASVH